MFQEVKLKYEELPFLRLNGLMCMDNCPHQIALAEKSLPGYIHPFNKKKCKQKYALQVSSLF